MAIQRYSYNIPQCYLELARSIFGPLTGKEALACLDDKERSGRLMNISFSLAALTIANSALGLESFVNSQIYWIWEQRHDGSEEASRLLNRIGDEERFENYKSHKKMTELVERIKTLYAILGLEQIHESDPKLWKNVRIIAKDARHFIIHPYPDPEYFSNNMNRILSESTWGLYVETVQGVITDLYKKSGRDVPSWVGTSELFRCRGFEALKPNT